MFLGTYVIMANTQITTHETFFSTLSLSSSLPLSFIPIFSSPLFPSIHSRFISSSSFNFYIVPFLSLSRFHSPSIHSLFSSLFDIYIVPPPLLPPPPPSSLSLIELLTVLSQNDIAVRDSGSKKQCYWH